MAGNPLSIEDATKIVESVGDVNKGRIKYTDFLMATVDLKKELSDEVLSNVFQHFDRKNEGFIRAENLLTALQSTGMNVDLDDLRTFTGNTELTLKSQIDYTTFVAIMMADSASP
jgi:Ca2+-binding EF-hand superfamily protein